MRSSSLVVDNIEATTMADDKGVEPLSPRSAMFAHTDSTYIVATMGFGSPINVEIFKKNLSAALLDNLRFSSLLVGDVKKSNELRWVYTPNVNINDHIIVPSINPKYLNTNSLDANKYVEDYLHSLTKTPMDTSKPLWDFHLLDLKTTDAESTGIFRIHHALGDGTSLISLVLSCGRQLSNPDALPTIPTMKKKEKNGDTNYFVTTFFLAMWWWLQVFLNTITGLVRFLVTTLFLKDSDFLIMASPEAKNKPRKIVYKTISLDDIKLVKNAMNVTINDVALGITEAGFSRHLVRIFSNDTIEEEKKANNFLQNIRMTITMAVNLRATKGIQNLADMKNKNKCNKAGWGNQIGFVLLPLSIGLLFDPLEYVRKAKAIGNRMKSSFEAQVSLKINAIATKLFGIKIAGSMWLNYTSHVSVLFSNVPGPVEEITFCGHPLKFVAPSLYALSTPVVIHFQSYVNKMTIAISVRDDVIIDPQQLCDDIAQSLVLFKHAIKN